MIHSPETRQQATDLYFKIEKHILTGGAPLSLRDVNKMLGHSSSASAQFYLKMLEDWKLIKRIPFRMRTITLAKTNYPPVEYRHI